jgi:hypothetical protein
MRSARDHYTTLHRGKNAKFPRFFCCLRVLFPPRPPADGVLTNAAPYCHPMHGAFDAIGQTISEESCSDREFRQSSQNRRISWIRHPAKCNMH